MTETAAPHGEATHEAVEAATAGADGDASGGHDSAGHDALDTGAPLGPLDAQAWGAGILGVLTGGLVALLLYLVSYH